MVSDPPIENIEEQEVFQETISEEQPPLIPKDPVKAMEYKVLGNQFFKEQDTNQALDNYEKALEICPTSEISLILALYSNMAICYSKHKDYDSVIEFTTKALAIDCSHFKSLHNRAQAYEAQDKPEEALEDYKKIVSLNQNANEQVFFKGKIVEIEKKVAELTEKRKNEVFDSLKKLGNGILGHFGMSLDNFKMEQNQGGSYNISFKQ